MLQTSNDDVLRLCRFSPCAAIKLDGDPCTSLSSSASSAPRSPSLQNSDYWWSDNCVRGRGAGDGDGEGDVGGDEYETPGAAVLPPIRERPVSSCRRRVCSGKKRVSTSFPTVPYVSASRSIFARKRAVVNASEGGGDTEAAAVEDGAGRAVGLNGNCGRDMCTGRIREVGESRIPSDEARSALASMSSEEILSGRRNVLDMLKPQSVRFLQERWRNRAIGQYSNDFIHGAESSITATDSKVYVPTSAPVITDYVVSPSLRKDDEPLRHPTSRGTTSMPISKKAVVHSKSHPHADDIRDSVLISPSPTDDSELDKRLWMTDATVTLPCDSDLNQHLQASVHAMGPVATNRYDLSGRILTPEQVQTLPTHLGLHHHGSSPADAGYTIADILTLLRSTVTTQRVAALRMLSSLLARYGADIADVLVSSGAIALAFAPFPSPTAFHGAVANQVAYVDAIDVLIPKVLLGSPRSMIRDSFFTSRFYSPLEERVDGAGRGVIPALAETNVTVTLLRVAFATAANPDIGDVAWKALNLVRTLILSCENVCRTVLDDKHAVAILQKLSASPEGHARTLAMMACDVVAQLVMRVGWGDNGRSVGQCLLTEVFLRNTCNQLSVVALEGEKVLTTGDVACAIGALRVMRAALAFQHGVLFFSGSLQAVCRLIYEDGDTAIEAYLALEAYIHCLHEILSTRGIGHVDSMRGSKDNCREVWNEVTDSFVMDQISGLVPLALAAVRRFSRLEREGETSVQAAAGHFAATFFAVYRLPFDASLHALISNCCSDASSKIAKLQTCDTANVTLLRSLASVCHAGARLLARVDMDIGYVQHELDILLRAAGTEGETGGGDGDGGVMGTVWRPVANACAEWLGLLAGVRCDVKCVRQAVLLMPSLCDPQVVMDVLSRCVLRAQALCDMSSSLSEEDAKKCAVDLLAVSYEGLCSMIGRGGNDGGIVSDHGDDADEESTKERRKEIPVSLLSLMKKWTESESCIPSFIRATSCFTEVGVIDTVDTFEMLAAIPWKRYKQHCDAFFSLMFATGKRAVSSTGLLIRRKGKTALSGVSTIPNSPLADGILQLGDRLVDGGPQSASVGDGCGAKNGALASVVLNLIFRTDADASLRHSLWTKTISNCGSAVLFSGAEMMIPYAAGHDRVADRGVEDEQMLVAYCSSLVGGYLHANRCPAVVGDAVVEKMNAAIEQNHSRDVAFRMLSSALRQDDGPSSLAYASLTSLLYSAKQRDHCCEYEHLAQWLDNQMREPN